MRQNRIMYRLDLEYNADWAGKHYAVKQVLVPGKEVHAYAVIAHLPRVLQRTVS